jgi:hypothetical protein
MITVAYGFDVQRRRLTASCQLSSHNNGYHSYLPSIVVVAIDVKDLLALDTKYTASMSIWARISSHSSPCVTLKAHIL